MENRPKQKPGKGEFLLLTLGILFVVLLVLMLVEFDAVSRTVARVPEIGTEERMKYEVSQVIKPDQSVWAYTQKANMDLLVIFFAKDAPFFDLTEEQFQIECKDILKAIYRSGFKNYYHVSIIYKAPLVDEYNVPLRDEYGNEQDQSIAIAGFMESALDKVKYEDLLHVDLETIAESYTFHPVSELEK